MTVELWSAIDGFPNYEVSNLGDVRSTNYNKTGMTKKLKLIKTSGGYLTVTLSCNHVQKREKVHRLVAKAFIPNPENKQEVNHKDGNKTNNRLDNLEWATRSENQLHAFANGMKENVRRAVRELNKKKGTKVVAIAKDGTRREYPSQSEAARELKLKQVHISAVLKGKQKTTGGYRFVVC